jgi:hypothetical protein
MPNLTRYSWEMAVTTDPADRAAAQPHSGAFTETTWFSGPAPANNSPLLIAIAQARAALLPTECGVIGWRVASYTVVANKLVPGGTSTFKRLFPGNFGYTVDVPQATVRINGTTSSGNTVKYNLKAVPDDMVKRGEFQPDRTYGNLLTGWFQSLTNAAMGTIGIDVSQPRMRVQSLAGGVLTVDNAASVAQGDYVRLLRVRDSVTGKPISGSFLIAVKALNALTLQGISMTAVSGPGGGARKDTIVWGAYQGLNAGRVGVHKIGGPLEKYRGRRSRRRV